MIDDATTPPESIQTVPRTRRALLTGVAGSLAGLFIARLGVADPVAAAAGGPVIQGVSNDAGTSNTTLVTDSAGTALQVTQNGRARPCVGLPSAPVDRRVLHRHQPGPGISGVTGRNASHGVLRRERRLGIRGWRGSASIGSAEPRACCLG